MTPEWRAFLAYEIERNRALYSFADTGIAMLPPRSARCVGTARVLYAQILDQIERNGYDVFSRRARVPTLRKAATAARMMVTGPRTLNRRAELYQRRSMTAMSLRTRTSSLPQVSRPSVRSRIPISRMPQPRENRMATTWRLAKPARIAAALRVAQSRDSGGWFVAGSSADVGRKESVTRTIAGREVVFWRNSAGGLIAGPGACPHLGALLDKCPVIDGTMYCRWHGLALTQSGDQTWSPYRAYDDGVLIWVGLPTDGEVATDRPSLPARPPLSESVSAVISEAGDL